MHLSTHDSPYREPGHKPAKPPGSSGRARSSSRRRGRGGKPAHKPATQAHKPATPAHKPATQAHKPATPAHKPAKHAHKPAKQAHKPAKHAKPVRHRPSLTSHPTTRNAFVATREWLLEQHGPVCAYCGTRHAERTMTLDHVAPRRGQTAYDRRDNLVLACKSCNQKKRDLAPLAFLLGLRSRAANLLKYGAHLSAGLLDLARSLVPEHERHHATPRHRHAPHEGDDDSPYRD